jgi:paromamine 6'-oxidase/6'''-hydroxyneomycin C oxidase/2'-deamino-2'-hydroxyparomamine 6'-oxidase
MGKDPASSVTDPGGRVHSVPNLYIADGSLLVNSGGSNPSLTIQALAYRVASRVIHDHRRSS